MYYIRINGRRWKVREAISIQAACDAIAIARVSGSVGAKNCYDRTYIGGGVTVLADVVQLNSDYTERRAYQEAY